MNAASTIEQVIARQIWDSRGRPTVEVEIRTNGGAQGRGIAPAGASRGTREAVELRDGGARFGGHGVDAAIANILGLLAPQLRGRRIDEPEQLDALITEVDGTSAMSRLGGNASTASSLAIWHAAAAHAGVPLWRLLAADRPVSLPMPQIQIFGGGAHAERRVDVQDFLAVPLGATSMRQALEMVEAVYRQAGVLMRERRLLAGTADEGGWWPAFDTNEGALEALTSAIERAGYRPLDEVGIAVDVAASEFASERGYRLGLERRELGREAWLEQLGTWIGRFPIVSIEDPFGQDDEAGWRAFGARYGAALQIVGDDFLVTSAERIRAAARAAACNAVLIKVNQRGTIGAAAAAVAAARESRFAAVVSARSGESEDTTIADLAVGWNAGQIKVGSFARGERTAKWNELLRIEEALGSEAVFAGRSALSGLAAKGGARARA